MTAPAVEAPGLRVLVVDDHDVVQWGFRLLLARQPWVASCVAVSTADEALAEARRSPPDVAVVDLFLGRESGALLCERLRALSPATSVLLVSGAGTISATAARAAGAAGFVAKDLPAADTVAAVRMVGAGLTVFRAGEVEAPGAAPTKPLTAREQEVLAGLAAGHTNREIAEQLHLSADTVKDAVVRLRRKLGARNRTEAVRLAQQAGLL